MARPEAKFLTDLKKSFKREGAWYYKIPDTPPTERFTPAKPFDSVLCVNGGLVAIEGKWLDWTKGDSGFSFKMLRDSQILGLQDVEAAKGISYVALGLRAARGDVRALFWEYRVFKSLCEMNRGVIPRKELEQTKYFPLRKDAQYNLSPFVQEIKAHYFYQNLFD